MIHCFFFLFKQKTAYEMRISDWSSDVCSSDLPPSPHSLRDNQKEGPMRAWMQRFLLALTLLWVPALVEAKPVAPVHPVLASGDMRTKLDLSGLWHYSIDPYRDGMDGLYGGDPGIGHCRYDTTDGADANDRQ